MVKKPAKPAKASKSRGGARPAAAPVAAPAPPHAHGPGFLAIVADAKRRVREVSAADVQARLAAGDAFHFLDVREDSEWAVDRARGATHLGKGVIERDIEERIPDKGADIVCYCGGGFRSALVADTLQRMGYTNVTSMAGGIRAWRVAGYPLTAGDASA